MFVKNVGIRYLGLHVIDHPGILPESFGSGVSIGGVLGVISPLFGSVATKKLGFRKTITMSQ